MAAFVGSENGDLGFQIAPMVDVVFVLLLFFMAAAGAKVMEKDLVFNVPAEGRGEKVPIVVEISAEGLVSVNETVLGQPADRQLSSLRGWLRGVLSDFGHDDPVVIRPAPDARQGRIIDVLNACGAEKVKKLTFG